MAGTSYHVFSLPPAMLDAFTPRNLLTANQTNVAKETLSTPDTQTATTSKGPRSCNVCPGATFVSLDEQRNHFRSDWHRYNTKTRLNGGNPVAEPAFSQLIDALDESLSGSESSTEDELSDDQDRVRDLLSRTKIHSRSTSPDESEIRNTQQTPLTWFHSPPSTQIGVYRALFSDPKDATSHLDNLKEMQTPISGGRTWALFMVAGGHFAGAIVRVSPDDEEEEPETKKKRPKKPKPDTEVLRHKTFHRYTTRRKQGGSQSVNDNAKGPAKSAGAQLRRYGEQALREDIRGLLAEWADDLNECDRIWIRASVSNRRIFVDYEEAVIPKGDERLRTFPFPTRRPTQSEIARCLLELTRVKVSHFTEEELKAQDEAYLASLPKPKPKPMPATSAEPEKPKAPKLTKEEELMREKWSRLLEMVSRGRLDPLKAFWSKEEFSIGGVNTPIPEWTGDRRATLLQVASQAGHEGVVQWLLEELRADPTISVPNTRAGEPEETEGQLSDASDSPAALPKGSRRTAYDLAKTKAVRDVFRRCAGAHPDWWDWLGAARVPSALSKEQEDERDEKKKVRRKGLKDRLKEREAREKEKEKEQPKVIEEEKPPVSKSSNPTTNKLGGASGSTNAVAGLTPEMRAKVERERRARAAEARLKALGIQ